MRLKIMDSWMRGVMVADLSPNCGGEEGGR